VTKRFLSAATVVALLAVLAIGAVGCSSGTDDTAGGDDGVTKVAVLFPGVIYDKSWNQQGYEGLARAQEEVGVEIAYTENVKHDEQIEIFRNYAQQGYDIIIGHGGEMMDAALTVAEEYPDIEFVVTNGSECAENVTSIRISYPDMGYLAGVFAGSMTETNKVAIVLAEPVPLVQLGEKGFEMGVARANPDAEVYTVMTGDWADVNKAREAAVALIADGVDVLFHILDAADVGVLTAAEDESVMAIGLYTDQSHIAPGAVIGSALGHPGNLIYKAASGELLNHQINTIGAETPDTVRVDGYSDKVPQEVRDIVAEAAEDLANDVVVVTLDEAEGE